MPTWNLTPILGGKSPDSLIASLKRDVSRFKSFRKKLGSMNEADMLKILDISDSISAKTSQLQGYYALKFYSNTKDSDALAQMTMLKQLTTDLGNDMLFFSIWLMHLDDKKAGKFLKSQRLSRYRHHLERIRDLKNHTLPEDVEKIINIKNITSGSHFDIYEILTNNFSYDFLGKNITVEEVVAHYRNPYPKLRQKAYETVLSRYRQYSSEIAEIYKNIVLDWDNETVKIRKYATPITSRNLGNDMDDKTINVLLSVIRKNAGLFHEYFRLKYKIISR